MIQDIRYALRGFAKKPGFAAIALMSVALGIGASTAVFAFVNAVLLNPLPYPEPSRIVFPWRQSPPGLNLGYNEIPWGLRDVHAMERDLKAFQYVGAFKSDYFNLTGSGEPVRLNGVRASAGFFGALGVAPELGRTFSPEEDQPGREHEVVLSDSLWREQFGGDRGVLGRNVELGGSAYAVVGVMPAGFAFPHAEDMPKGFEFPRAAQLWVPLALASETVHPWDPDELAVIARLRPGVSLDQAQAGMDVFARYRESQSRAATGWFNSRVTTIHQQVTGDTRRPLLLILGAVVVVLLIACSNVASLVLAQSFGRRHEFTLRAALGARHGRLVRQVLTESGVLAVGGGVGGILLASAGVQLVKAFGPANLPRLGEAGLDAGVFVFALGATLLTGILCGLTPAIGAARANLADSLKEGGLRSIGSGIGPNVRKTLLVSEIALALVLVVAAGLLTQTFFRLWSVDKGYRPTRVLTFELSLPESGYSDPGRAATLYTGILQRLKSVPGVEFAGIAKTIPLGGAPDSTGIRISGRLPADLKIRPIASYNLASPGYFSAVGTPILRGREFMDADTAANGRPVVVINRSMAESFWPGEDAIGQQVAPASPAFPLMTVVGIAADVKDLSMRQVPGPEMYVPYTVKTYVSLLTMQAVVRTKAEPAAMAKSIEAAIHEVDSWLPMAKVATLETLVDASMAQPRFAMLLLAAFGAVALLLAMIGMYGVISYSVAQRTREIGVRVVLGARPGDVFAMVLGQGAKLAAAGVGIGLLAALGATRLMASFLYGVKPADPLTFTGVAIFLVAVAMAACYLPARRATRVDPMEALRHQ
jgi:predicted permease